ncbi:MAG: 16S rRNA processing protein RimM [Firmicutes bacterium]|nr:16S rRNA processing protein RimM [Bacillota bacterium]
MKEKEWPEELVAVAQVVSPQGNRGQVKAIPLTGHLERFDTLQRVMVWKDGRMRPLTLTTWRAWRGFVILAFAELTTMDEAEALRGAMICVRVEERAALPADEYYHDDLFGLQVLTEDGRLLGRITEILATGANDVLVVADEAGKEVLLPALREVVVQVDLAAGRMIVHPLPGLLD